MDELILIKPEKDLEVQANGYFQEHKENGEYILHGSALMDKLPFDEWLKWINNNSDERTVNPNWVASSTFFAVRKDDRRIVGMIDIRHKLNDFLQNYGGHIGYGVRPTERRKGYATQMLRMALEYSKNLGLDKVMLACYKDNIASKSTIIKCGGVLEREFFYLDGNIVQVYWITL